MVYLKTFIRAFHKFILRNLSLPYIAYALGNATFLSWIKRVDQDIGKTGADEAHNDCHPNGQTQE